jgi:TonB-linked outer membrane protein, SusC/RagA family
MHADLEMKCTTRPCLPNPPSLWLPDEPAASAGSYPSTHRRVYDMKLRIFGCVLLLGLSIPITARAQATGQVSGVVTADDGRPVSNAQVSVLTTSLLARTDSVGRYQFARVPAGPHTLRATSLGHAAQELPVTVSAGATATLNFRLAIVAAKLDQVVVVGYGEQKRGEITSAVASVDTTQFVQGPARDAASMIAGKIPGLAVTTPSGDPRSNTQISLRGVTTIQGSTSPLVLIDGVPGSLGTVATPDIASISVLKDGSAAAVYGSRASNGVILITTKRHTGNKPTLRYDGYVSQQSIYNRPDFLTASDYRRLKGEGYDFEDLGFNTDWEAAILRSPVSQRHNVSIGGGDVATNYTASVNYDKAQGIFLRSDNKEVTARGDIRHSMFNGKLDANLTILNRTQDYFTGPSYSGAWRQALIRNPTDREVDDDGMWQERGTYMYTNPLGLIEEDNGQHEGRDTRLHATVTARPFETLRLSLSGGTDRSSYLDGEATTFKHVNTTQSGRNGTASRGSGSGVDRILEGTGTYNNSFGRQDVTLLGGYSYQDFEDESFSANTSEFPTDLFGYDALQRGAAITDGKAGISSGKESNKLIGFFGRLNYDWADKYLLMGSVRYEGNSRFGADHKWGLFPAVSAAWRLSSEPFIQRFSWINDLKLRAGYGVTGIAPTDSYLSLTSYAYGSNSSKFLYNGEWVSSLAPARNPNPDLRWEEKHEINTGIDYSLFNSRVTGTLDVYRRETRDMLYNYSVPVPPNLFGSILANVGTMRNNGIEAQIAVDVIRNRDLTWNTSVNWSHNTNMLVSLSNKQYQSSDCFYPGYTGEPIQVSTHRVCVGEQIGDFFGWKSVDIDTAGEWVVLDTANNRIPIRKAKAADRRVLGNGIPKHYAAWNNSVRYRNFDLDVNMRGAFSFQILNFQRMFYENPKITQYNMLKSAFDKVYGKRTVNYDLAYVSYYLENGDYMKLDNVTLGYSLNQALVNRLTSSITGARFYVAGRNLLTLTGYKGMDPEVSTAGLDPGTDNRDQYPTTRMFTFGMTLSF